GTILVLTPGYTNAVAGATALNVAGGISGFAGILGPELVLAGVSAQPDAVEEAFGQLVGDGFRPEAVTEELRRRWETTRNYFRLRACCNPIYSALDALEDILAEIRPRSRRRRGHRGRDVPLRCEHVRARSGELLCREILATTRGGGARAEGPRRLSRVHRRDRSRSRDGRASPAGDGARGSGSQRTGAAAQAGSRDRHLHRWTSDHAAPRERPR